jgi:DNA processing protein
MSSIALILAESAKMVKMSYSIRALQSNAFPPLLREISDPPKALFLAGTLPQEGNKLLCIVGSRKHTSYGKEVTEAVIAGLRGYPISIVSGLALGIDSIAHRAALRSGLHTIAIPGSGLDPAVLYPQSHRGLAEEIIGAGGALLSEFENDFSATPWSFPKRNRLMAGMSHATLVIEAETKSGTLITSRLATEYNRDVGAVPGSIFSKQSEGPHMLIRLGATPIRSAADCLEILGFNPSNTEPKAYEGETPQEKVILDLLTEGKARDDIIRESGLPVQIVASTLAVLEIKGVIGESMGEIHRLR